MDAPDTIKGCATHKRKGTTIMSASTANLNISTTKFSEVLFSGDCSTGGRGDVCGAEDAPSDDDNEEREARFKGSIRTSSISNFLQCKQRYAIQIYQCMLMIRI